MSKSIHITKKNFKGLTKSELDEQSEDPNSELRQWARKSLLKKEVVKKRKNKKSSNIINVRFIFQLVANGFVYD